MVVEIVNPARAGMIPNGVQVTGGDGCKPRASGDDPRHFQRRVPD